MRRRGLFSRRSPDIMHNRWFTIAGLVVAFLAAAASAQERRSEVSVQGIGLFIGSWSGTSILASPMSGTASDSGGALLSYRYNLRRWLAAEANYSFASNSENFSTPEGSFGGRVSLQALTAGIVLKAPTIKRLTPYALADGGELFFNPTAADFFTDHAPARQSRGVVAYGGGARYRLTERLSLVGECREVRYVAPDFSLLTITSGVLMHSLQPSAGIAFRF